MHIYSSHCVRWLLSGLRYIWGFGLVVLLHRAVEALIANVLIKTTNLVLLGNAQLQQQICLKNMLDLVMSKAEFANCTCDMMLLEPRKSIDIRSCSAPAYRNPSWLQPPTTKKKGTRTVSWFVFGSLHFALGLFVSDFSFFLDATFSLGVFCFPFFGSHFRCHIFLLPFLLPNFWSQSFL